MFRRYSAYISTCFFFMETLILFSLYFQLHAVRTEVALNTEMVYAARATMQFGWLFLFLPWKNYSIICRFSRRQQNQWGLIFLMGITGTDTAAQSARVPRRILPYLRLSIFAFAGNHVQLSLWLQTGYGLSNKQQAYPRSLLVLLLKRRCRHRHYQKYENGTKASPNG